MKILTTISENEKSEIAFHCGKKDGTNYRTLYEYLLPFPDVSYPNGWGLQHRNAYKYIADVTKRMANVKKMSILWTVLCAVCILTQLKCLGRINTCFLSKLRDSLIT